MQLFYKRPLSLILCIMLGGLTLFTVGNDIIKAIIAFSAAVSFIAFVISVILKKKKIIFFLISASLIFSMLFSNLYFYNWFYADARFEGEVKVEGTLIELVAENYSTTNYIIRTDSIDGKPNSSYKLSVYFEQEDAERLSVGSVVEFTATIEPHTNKNTEGYRYSKGISAVCDNISDINIHEETRFVMEKYFSDMREWLTRHAIFLSDESSGEMVSALLFGERNSLSPKVSLDFERLGITHILALSGMHLTLLSLAVDKILSLFSLHKKIRVIISALLAFLYMAFTGFPSSVLRAGIMLIISSVIYLISREADSITVLFTSVAIIIFFSPYAIYDIALWLSAFATLGVIVYSDYKAKTRDKNKAKSKIKDYITESLAISAFAITATLFITHFSFDGISIISPIATLVFTVLTTIIMYLGALMLIIGSIIPIGRLLIPIVGLTEGTAKFMSSFNIYVDKDHIVLDIIVIILSVMFFGFLILKIRQKKIAVILILTVFCSLYLTAGIIGEAERQNEVISYSSEGKYNSFVIRSNGESALVSSSLYSKSSGYFALSALEDVGITRLDIYCVANLTKNLEKDLDIVLSGILTDKLYLPKPKNSDEQDIIDKLYMLIEDYHTEICLYDEFDKPKIGNYEIVPLYSVAYGEGTAKNAFSIHGGGENILYLSSGLLGGEMDALADELLERCNIAVLGSHGTNYKNAIYLKADYELLQKIVFDAQYIFMTQDTAIHYNEKGCEIYSHPKSIILVD